MKRNLLLILLGLLPLVASAYDAEIDGIYYNFSENEATVTYKDWNYNSYSGDVTIPASVTYEDRFYTVTSIGEYAFAECSALTSITIPNSVTNVDNNAFRKCESLTSVVFKGNSVHFGIGVFMLCTSLKTLELPAGDEVLAERLLGGCTSLETLIIPEGYKSFRRTSLGGGGLAGKYTTNLRNLSLPTTMESLENLPSEVIKGLTTLYITPEMLRSLVEESYSQWWISQWVDFLQSKCPNMIDLYVRASSIQDICENGVLNGYETGHIDTHAHLLINGEEIKDLQIPMGVDSLAESAFAYMGFETVSIPSSLTSLNKRTFFQCWNIKEVTIPGTVKTIGEGAFSRCKSLEKVTLEEGVEAMEAWTFDTSPLKELHLPSSLKQIENGDFESCNSLTDVYCYAEQVPTTSPTAFKLTPIEKIRLHVPAVSLISYKNSYPWSNFGTIKPLGETNDYAYIDGICYTFSGNDAKVTSVDGTISGAVTIPESVTFNDKSYKVTSIGNSAFYNCTGMSSIKIPGSVTNVGSNAFYNCTGLTKVIISDIAAWCSIPFGNYYANPIYFAEHIYSDEETEITDLVIPNGVTSIGERAFQNCIGLTSITFPNSVTTIGNLAFNDCCNLSSIKVEEGNTRYDSREGCNAIIETVSNTLVFGCKNTIIPSSVTTIGDYAFYNCNSLTSITIPNSVISIGNSAFYRCNSLTSVTIPNSVTSIDSNAFNACSGLTSISISNSIIHIGGSVFSGCTNLQYNENRDLLYLGNDENPYIVLVKAKSTDITICEIDAGCKLICDGAFRYCQNLTSVTIPKNVVSVNTYAFEYCYSLTSVTLETDAIASESRAINYNLSSVFGNQVKEYIIGGNVKTIGDYAFSYCENLSSVTIGNSVNAIGTCAFYYCSSLNSINIPNRVTSIGYGAFYGCSALTSVAIPKSVTSIGDYAFSGCSSISYLSVEKGNLNYDSRDNCNAIIETSTNTLLTGCKNTVIPSSVTSIADYAFSRCVGMSSVTIGNNIRYVGNNAFLGCSNLTDVYCFAVNVPETGGNAFNQSPIESATLHVPASALEAYKTTEPWSNFGSIVAITEDDITPVNSISSDGPSNTIPVYYDLNGRRVQQPHNGIFIKNGKKIVISE